MKRIIKIMVPLLRIIFSCFYNKEYLRGKYFDYSYGGWLWAFRGIYWQKIMGINRKVPWPVSPFSVLQNHKNISFHVDDINIFQTHGCYFQNNFGGHITIGKGSYIAPNVGLITSNHSISDIDKHDEPKDIVIGEKCWIGMNSVILPGVELGNNTIVGAGAVVTKSFPMGNCIIAGVPADIIKRVDQIDENNL